MATTSSNETTFTVRRLSVAVPGRAWVPAELRSRMPEVPQDQVKALVDRGAPWSEMKELIASSAPHGVQPRYM